MEKLKKYVSLAVFIALIAACLGEFILCFARGYEELWYTILVPSVIISALAVGGWLTKLRWLYFIATAIIVAGAILLIGFPSYVMYLALILGGVSLVGEIALLIFYIKDRKTN